jgi:hypothetical protein
MAVMLFSHRLKRLASWSSSKLRTQRLTLRLIRSMSPDGSILNATISVHSARMYRIGVPGHTVILPRWYRTETDSPVMLQLFVEHRFTP